MDKRWAVAAFWISAIICFFKSVLWFYDPTLCRTFYLEINGNDLRTVSLFSTYLKARACTWAPYTAEQGWVIYLIAGMSFQRLCFFCCTFCSVAPCTKIEPLLGSAFLNEAQSRRTSKAGAMYQLHVSLELKETGMWSKAGGKSLGFVAAGWHQRAAGITSRLQRGFRLTGENFKSHCSLLTTLVLSPPTMVIYAGLKKLWWTEIST